jgi:hypothetical protein
MSSSNSRPKWWRLYLTFPLLIVLFAVDSRLRISTRGHQLVQIGIVLLVYGLVHLWIKANSTAITKINREQYRGRITVIRAHLSQLPGSDKDKRSALQLAAMEIKGVLSDTFEMDYIDAESFPIEEVPQKIDKE